MGIHYESRICAGAHFLAPGLQSLRNAKAIEPTTFRAAVSFPSANIRYTFFKVEWTGTRPPARTVVLYTPEKSNLWEHKFVLKTTLGLSGRLKVSYGRFRSAFSINYPCPFTRSLYAVSGFNNDALGLLYVVTTLLPLLRGRLVRPRTS